MGVAEFLSFNVGLGFACCPERGGAPCRGRCHRATERGRCPARGRANRHRARGGRGDQAFFPSARDQSVLYKLELLPPTDERARPRRYPAAPAPGPGAALTLPAPGVPLLLPRPPVRPLILRDPVPISLAKRLKRKHELYPHPSPWSRVNWRRGRRKHHP